MIIEKHFILFFEPRNGEMSSLRDLVDIKIVFSTIMPAFQALKKWIVYCLPDYSIAVFRE